MRRLSIILAIAAVTLTANSGFALDYKPLYPGFTPIRESKAYQKFATRPLTDFSKLLYLIDRFGDSEILINYDNQNYTAKFAITVARWFLARNYKKQTPEEWINQWCTKAIGSNRPIFVKLPSGEFRPSREILLDELRAIEQVVRENNQKPKEIAAVAPPSAELPLLAAAVVPAASPVDVVTAATATATAEVKK